MRHPSRSVLACICLLAIALAACQPRPVQPSPVPGVTPSSPAQETLLAPSPTPAPSPTAEAPRALLIDPQSGSSSAQSPIRAEIEKLASDSQLLLSVQPQLVGEDLTATTRVVVALPPDPGLEGMANNHPEIQFVAVGISGVKPTANLNVIGMENQADQAAFLAGYIAALVSPDWRSGVVVSTSPEDVAARDAFLSGGRYLCGICNVPFKPYFYPVAIEAAAGDTQPAVDALKQNGVKTVFVAPSLATPEVYAALAQAGFQLIGFSSPGQDLRSSWIATVGSEPSTALATLWPDLVAGKGNRQLGIPLTVSDTADVLSPGRMNLVNQVIEDLSGGWIDPKPADSGS